MVSNQADVPRDVLKRVNLIPLAGAMSQVGSNLDLKQKKKKLWSHCRLIFNSNMALRVYMQTIAHLH